MRAFALKPEYADLEAGTVAYSPNGDTLDIGSVLRDGIIVVEDEAQGAALAGYHAVEELDGKRLTDAVAAHQAPPKRSGKGDA